MWRPSIRLALFAFVIALCFTKRGVVAQDQKPIRINAGGKRYRDRNGNVWSKDEYYYRGKAFSSSKWIFKTKDQGLYRSNRWDNKSSGNRLKYNIPVENGNYIVRMHFSELYKRAQRGGARVFDVLAEEKVVLRNLDIFAEVGGYTALIKETKVRVNDGELSISFARKAENPLISAIEVIPSSDDYTDPNGEIQKPELSPTPTPATRSQETQSEPMGGTAIWAKKGKDKMRYVDFDGSKFVSIHVGPDVQYKWSHVRGASAPTRDEKIVVGVSFDGSSNIGGSGSDGDSKSSITAVMCNGDDWNRLSISGVGSTLGSASDSGWNNAQVTYESQSGDAFLIWHDERRLLYSKWNGKEWTKIDSVSGIAGEPQWFDIASNPRSNEIVVAVTDSWKRVYVLVWDGSRWTSDPLHLSVGSHQAGIAVAYESQSGHAMVVYGNDYRSAKARYRVWNGSRWSKEASLESPLGASTVRWAVLRSDPYSDQIVLGIHNGDEAVWLSLWDGSNWESGSTVAATTSAGTQTNAQSVIYVDFEALSGNALAVYRSGRALRYRTLRVGTDSWSRSAFISEYRETPSSLILEPEPGSNRIMMLVQDDDGDIHSARWDGDRQAWDSVTKLESDTGERKNQPFAFLWESSKLLPLTGERAPPAPTPVSNPFGVNGFTFVDADRNEDIAGALTCDPVNACIGSTSRFSVRANTFGDDIAFVQMAMEGPLPRIRKEEAYPYSIFGDREGDYRGKSLLAGTYSITAFAVNSKGDSSENYTMTFDIADAPSQSPTDQPSLAPTPTSLVLTKKPSQSPTPEDDSKQRSFTPIYINCGGSVFTDESGNTWQADEYYNTGAKSKTKAQSIFGTSNEKLYLTDRWASSSGKDLRYDIPVPEGEYSVTLHFSENFKRLQVEYGRVFDVLMEGIIVFPDLDIFYQSGGPFAALRKTRTIFVSDGSLTIDFSRIIQNPKVSGIEVHLAEDAPYKDSEEVFEPVPTPPTRAPQSEPGPANDFETIRINAGGETYTDSNGLSWDADQFFENGEPVATDETITGTSSQSLLQTARSTTSSNLVYEINVPNGEYLVTLYFVDIFPETHQNGGRVFDVLIEGFGELKDIDIFNEVGGFAVLEKQAPVTVSDRDLRIELKSVVNAPLISAIEVEALGTAAPRQAHAVSGGPYFANVPQEDAIASVTIDGSFSHSHGPDAKIISWKWKLDGDVVGREEVLTLELPVGTYSLTLLVVDSDNAKSRDSTTITIELPPFPKIESLKPDTANVAGGGVLVISGSDFAASEDETTVFFGSEELTGQSQITVVDESTIEVKMIPSVDDAGSVDVIVETPNGMSNVGTFAYIEGMPIAFSTGIVDSTYGPTCITCGPDGKIYVGTQTGTIFKIEVDDEYEVISKVTSYAITASSTQFRSILGIAVDPMDTSSNPAVYVAHSTLFHGRLESYNGKVSKVSGRELDVVEDIVKGLPVSDLDHGINGLEFGDNGELYISVGANTNAGVPGPLSSTGRQKDGLFSGATLVAHLSRPDFDGDITYDDNGDQVTGFDVEIFAAGQRNPYDITLHSNGMLYGTDNGANFGFGRKSVTCDTDEIDPMEGDELNLLEKGRYYGQANRKRGQDDPRQCQWRSQTEPSDEEYTAPIALLESSTDGVIEFQTEHFDGKLRGHLILSQYKGGLYQLELSSDGRSTIDKNVTFLDENGGLALTQGPDGTLFIAQNDNGRVIFVTPKERPSDGLVPVVKSVFPRRGPQDGGSILHVYGENLNKFGTPSVTIGGKDCSVQDEDNDSIISCRLPSGKGTADVVVTVGSKSATFARGYRFISGKEVKT